MMPVSLHSPILLKAVQVCLTGSVRSKVVDNYVVLLHGA